MFGRLWNQITTNLQRVGEEFSAWKAGISPTLERFEYGTWNPMEKQNYYHLAMAVIVDTVRLMPRTVSYSLVLLSFAALVAYLV